MGFQPVGACVLRNGHLISNNILITPLISHSFPAYAKPSKLINPPKPSPDLANTSPGYVIALDRSGETPFHASLRESVEYEL